jgi:two-component system OmpR family response regulator
MEAQSRILVAEDDDDVRSLVAAALARAGFATLRAATGLEALRLAVQERPDLVVLDVGLPALDGHGVMRILRNKGDAPLVVFLTARATDRDRAEGLGLGAVDYVTKPFDVRDLVARVATALRAGGRLHVSA